MNNVATTLRDAIIWFADFEHCRQFMVELRWADGAVRCPHCGSDNVTWLAKTRVWKCYAKHTRPTFTLKTGTIFEDSPIPLEKWLTAAWLIISCKNGVSSYEIHRALGVTQKSAWFMLHRIRLAMQETGFAKLGGEGREIEADETLVGGKIKNMHRRSKRSVRAMSEGTWGKTVVLGLLEREGRVRAAVATNRRKHHVQPNILANVEPGSNLYTDNLATYDGLSKTFEHQFVDHVVSYVQGRVHTNGMENFWSLLKRMLKGTYVSVDPVHLQAYTDEQCFRFNNRDLTDAERFAIVMRQIVGRRLTYNELIGKTEFTAVMRP